MQTNRARTPWRTLAEAPCRNFSLAGLPTAAGAQVKEVFEQALSSGPSAALPCFSLLSPSPALPVSAEACATEALQHLALMHSHGVVAAIIVIIINYYDYQ